MQRHVPKRLHVWQRSRSRSASFPNIYGTRLSSTITKGLTMLSKIGQASVVLLWRTLRYIFVMMLTYIGTINARYTKDNNDSRDQYMLVEALDGSTCAKVDSAVAMKHLPQITTKKKSEGGQDTIGAQGSTTYRVHSDRDNENHAQSPSTPVMVMRDAKMTRVSRAPMACDSHGDRKVTAQEFTDRGLSPKDKASRKKRAKKNRSKKSIGKQPVEIGAVVDSHVDEGDFQVVLYREHKDSEQSHHPSTKQQKHNHPITTISHHRDGVKSCLHDPRVDECWIGSPKGVIKSEGSGSETNSPMPSDHQMGPSEFIESLGHVRQESELEAAWLAASTAAANLDLGSFDADSAECNFPTINQSSDLHALSSVGSSFSWSTSGSLSFGSSGLPSFHDPIMSLFSEPFRTQTEECSTHNKDFLPASQSFENIKDIWENDRK